MYWDTSFIICTLTVKYVTFVICIKGGLLPLDILDSQIEESEHTENDTTQEINQEDKEYVKMEAITDKPQTEQKINKDVADVSPEGGSNRSNLDHSNNKLDVDKFVDEEDFHTDVELVEDIKIG